jgi:uncharacterized protein
MKSILIISVILLFSAPVTKSDRQLKMFPLSSVKITGGPFYDAMMADEKYILDLDVDRLLAPFALEAGVQTDAERYGSWENTGLDGHIGGHYLSALALMHASTGNPELQRRLTYMVDKLAECQVRNGNGYVGGIPGGMEMWADIAKGNINAANFALNTKWVPLYNIHKLFAGLRDAYLVGGNAKALTVLVSLTEWFDGMVKNLTDTQIQQMLRSEHGGLNEVFADVSAITGDAKYLRLAERVSDQSVLVPLLSHTDKLTGMHANTQIPKVIGYKRVADLNGDNLWNNAAEFFWGTVVDDRSVSIGGNSVREHFHPADDYSSMVESVEGPETCNTYNMMRLTAMLWLTDPQSKYIDYYERAMYNHILSSQHPESGFVYFTPMRPNHYRVYSESQLDFWCCVGSGLENHAKYGELIYAHNDNDLFVNLFVPSTLKWKEKGLSLEQSTEFPFADRTDIKIELEKAAKFTLFVRKPGWVTEGEMKLHVNGKEIKGIESEGAYLPVYRKWKSGDRVTIITPMHTTAVYLPDNSPWVSFMHGPVVLAAETGAKDLIGLRSDGSRMGHIAHGPQYPVDEAPMIVTSSNDLTRALRSDDSKTLTFSIPGVIKPEAYGNLQLVPFFKVHDTRYVVYFRVASPSEYESIRDAVGDRERNRLALEARTIDKVAPGQQQPESDHNFREENSTAGILDGVQFRNARGWFSYDLRDGNGEASLLRVTYSGADRRSRFLILINEVQVADVNLTGSPARFLEIDYEIPQEAVARSQQGILTVKFIAAERSSVARVFNVRLLR